jgi:hypothetical protein
MIKNKELEKAIGDDSIVTGSTEYRTSLLRIAMQEYKTRQKMWYYNYQPSSPKHYDFHMCGKKIRINVGANRAGKTTAPVWDLIAVSLDEHPVYKLKVGMTGWVIGSDFRKIREVLFPKFDSMIPTNRIKERIYKPRSNEFGYILDNNFSILFKSQEQDISTFTSASIRWALVDERIKDLDMRNQIRMRVVDTDGLMVFTGDRLEDDEWIEDLAKLDYTLVTKFEFEDNARYLPMEEMKRLRQELDPIEQAKLLDGNFKSRDDKPRFTDNIFTPDNYIPLLPNRVNVEGGFINPCEDGYFRMFEEPMAGMQYVIGVDMAEGSGWNHTAMECFKHNGEQVFEFMTNKVHFSKLPELIGSVGKMYNNATVVIENKSYGVSTIDRMKDFYPNLYMEPTFRANKFRKLDFGIKTERQLKENMIVNAIDFITNNKCLIKSDKLKGQLTRFITNKDGKSIGKKDRNDPEMFGNDDDNVMAFLFVMWAMNSMGIYKRFEYNSKKLLNNNAEFDKNKLTRYYRVGDSYVTTVPSVNFW